MLVKSAYEVPEYEINPNELDFSNSVDITKVFCICQFLLVSEKQYFLNKLYFTCLLDES